MDIKKLLEEKMLDAKELNKNQSLVRAEKEEEAKRNFRPIFDAANELQRLVADKPEIVIFVSEISVRIKLGSVTSLECGRFFTEKDIYVLETNKWGLPSYETTERKVRFESVEKLIEFLVTRVGEHLAKG